MKTKEEIFEIRNAMIEDYKNSRNKKELNDNFEVEEITTLGKISILTYILNQSFNPITLKVTKNK